MIFSNFRDVEVNAYLEPVGYPYVTGEDQNGIVRRSLERFTEETRCLFDDDIVFTTSGTDSFDTQDTAIFSVKVLRLQDVWIGGKKIAQMATSSDMALSNSGYQSQAAGDPSFWFTQGTSTLRFDKPLTGVIADSYVSGWYLHPTIGDTEDLLVPDTDIEACAMHVACDIMRPRATFGEVKNHRDALLKELQSLKSKILHRSETTQSPVQARRRRRVYHSL